MTVNTAVTTTPASNSSNANFQAWVQEVIDLLTANSGTAPVGVSLTHVTCSGEIDTTSVAAPTTSAPVAGFMVFEFNDPLFSSNPVLFKLWFGCTQYAATTPAMWIQVCSGTGAAVNTSTGVFSGGMQYPSTLVAPGGSIQVGYACYTSYSAPDNSSPLTSRVCYNPTYGFLGFNWKVGYVTANFAQNSFFLFRSNDATGAATADAVNVITPGNVASWTGASPGYMACMSDIASVVYPQVSGTVTPSNSWAMWPLNLNSTLYGSDVQMAPVFTMTPVVQVSNYLALALVPEIAMNAAITGVNLVGSLGLTYVQCGYPFGSAQPGNPSNPNSNPNTQGLMMLWQ